MVHGIYCCMNRLIVFFLLLWTSYSCLSTNSSLGESVEPHTMKALNGFLKPYYKAFMSAYDNIREKDAFIFFSDPHLLGDKSAFFPFEKQYLDSSFESMRILSNVLPLDFCLNGGDWLNNLDTQDAARFKLLYADARMKQWFPVYYKMLGNHDTNYQGFVSGDNLSRGDFSMDFINNVYFNEVGRSYYTFKGRETLFYIFDSGIDWEPAMNDYKMYQLKWFSESLMSNTNKHIVIGLHILFNYSSNDTNPAPFAMNLLALCKAFNDRESFEVDGVRYVFSNVIGKIHVVLAGHTHEDCLRTDLSVPCVVTTQFMKNDNPTFDLCLLDYDNGYLEMIRVGEGVNRKVKLNM